MKKKQTAYSLVELVIIVMFLGIIAAIAIPRLNFSAISKQNADTVAKKIVIDLRRTRRLAISDAANNTAGFALIMTGSTNYTGYEIQNLDSSAIIDTHIINADISCTGGNRFEFGPLGNLMVGSDNQLVISASGKTFTMDIIPATGMIKITEN